MLFARILASRSAGLAWAGAGELAWHLLGPAWAFAVLAAAVWWLARTLPALKMTTAEGLAKAYATENRVDALVPAVADAHSAATSAQSTANNALPKSGGTMSGDLHVSGYLYGAGGTLTIGDNVHVTSALTCDGRLGTHSGLWGDNTTGQGGQGSCMDNYDGDTHQGAAGSSYDQGAAQAAINRTSHLIDYHNGLTGDMDNLINRVNGILNAIG